MDGIHEGHRARMKKKLLENGERSLADHELLEVLLYYAIPRRDTNELAHRLLKQFGSLRGVLSAPVQELACVSGVGQQAALLLGMVPILCRRAAQREKEQILNSVDACGAYLRSCWAAAAGRCCGRYVWTARARSSPPGAWQREM